MSPVSILNTDLPAWVEKLPKVRGRYSFQSPLSKITWFQVGGVAEVIFKPADTEDLQHFLRHCPKLPPITLLGVGSNVLIRDGGVDGVVIRLGRSFNFCKKVSRTLLEVGAATLDRNVALAAAQHSLDGMAFLSGIPGTIGGALRMNAGAYGREMKDVVKYVHALDPDGNLHVIKGSDMHFSYRKCGVPNDWIFVAAALEGVPNRQEEILQQINDIQKIREISQPIRKKTGGSTFANPDGYKAWELIDRAGFRGEILGGAQVSEQHCNFLINNGTATAADLEQLGEKIKERVFLLSGVNLEWEIKRIGKFLDNNRE